MTSTPETKRGRTAGWWWPWFIAALLVATAGGQAIMLYAATHDPTFSIEPDYYSKAIAWDTTMQRDRETMTLGWKARATITGTTDMAQVRLVVTDSAGLPVGGARVRASAIHNLDGPHPIPLEFSDAGGGVYVASIAHARRGLWELRIDAERGTSRFAPSVRADFSP